MKACEEEMLAAGEVRPKDKRVTQTNTATYTSQLCSAVEVEENY